MKAIIYKRYGSPDVFKLKEIKTPVPKDDEVLVKIYASSVNAADVDQLKGVFMIRIGGLFRPKYKILGSDIAGVVEAIGKDVTLFKPGDEVFGDLTERGFGSFAEYACAPEKALTLKPASLTFEQAASITSAGLLAVQGLRDEDEIKPGDKILINGAGGSVGTIAIQIAKYYGAEVTAIDSEVKFDMLRSLGADHLIDYTKEDYTKTGKRYDRIVDNVALRSVDDYKEALNPKGKYVMVGGKASTILKIFIRGPKILKAEGKKLGLLIWKPNKKEDIDFLLELIDSGKVSPVIDRSFPLSETATAFKHFIEGHPLGKVIIKVCDN